MSLAYLRGVCRHYRMGNSVVRALDGIDLDIETGEYWAIQGRSGSGKSTLLNLLGCLDRPTAGTYVLDGVDVSALSDDALSHVRSRSIGFIFQSFNLIPQLTVEENIEVPLFYQGVAPPESRRRARELAARVGLTERLHHRPTELSGGQQQRVAIARALVNDPAIVLADEATGNLDSATENEILAVMDQLHGMGKTIILVTHNAALTRHAEKVMVLADGRIESLRTRAEADAAGEEVP
ncbi:MAG: ABC transporter ATP-binding protein [Planctomycetes bacterium]|nr:ABC transporter ATP-binding protein [Planctomycetota bacterium]